jgi:energy-coupling factor transport system permease protein
VSYRPRSSPLHAARAAVASVWCVTVTLVALSFDHPALLAGLLVAVLAAAAAARVVRSVLRALLWCLPFALVIALINPLVTREGLTVIARGGTVPVLGSLDITLEATAYGGILGLRALVIIACFALHSAAIDPDDLLRAVRRLSFRSALTAALATRMMPVLARDARRLHDAQRCRPGGPPSRLALLRAVSAGALDRAVDVAATLEVRGYGAARRPPRIARPWSRHDLAFAGSALALALLALGSWIGGWERFQAYPATRAPLDAGVAALGAALAACVLLPFADRRGIER